MRFLKYTLFALFAFSAISATVFNDKYFEIIKNIEIFSTVYKELNTHYVDDIDPGQLMRTGIDAMMESLDPYTVYYSESQVQSYRISTEGQYNGIGAVSKVIDGWVTITEIIENGPAHLAGIEVGDQIVKINGESTKDRSNDDVVQIVRGFPGSTLGMTINRDGQEQKFSLDRNNIQLKNVPYNGIVGDDIAYVNLTTFTQNASANIGKAIKEIKKEQDINGVILDLRYNGGGLLREAVGISNLFLGPDMEVVSTKGKVKDRDKSYKTTAEALDADIPLVVLINGRSASASEIVAGTIQDYDRGVIMGQRSFGKGLVQNHREVGYNSRIKVTTSKYYIPSGRCIQSIDYGADGDPKDIPDEDRAVFKTRNGRPVLDGGGVTPDVKLDGDDAPAILKSLENDNWLFKYINQYVNTHDSIGAPEDFKYTEYDNFVAFLKENDFSFQTEAEKELYELEEDANEEALALQSDIDAIKSKIELEKKDDLQEFEDVISRKIEQSIVARYHFETGKTQQRLRNDSEVDAAIALLKDTKRYKEILTVVK